MKRPMKVMCVKDFVGWAIAAVVHEPMSDNYDVTNELNFEEAEEVRCIPSQPQKKTEFEIVNYHTAQFHKGLLCSTPLAFVAGLSACSPGDDGIDEEVEFDTVTKTLRWTQERREIQDCHVFKLDNDEPIEVNRLSIDFDPGSHHVHVYRRPDSVDDDESDCFSGLDWDRWFLLFGAQFQPEDWRLPEGLTIPLDANQQLLVQVHWLNNTDGPIEREIDLTFHTAESSDRHLGVLFGVNQDVYTPARAERRIVDWCEAPDDVEIIAMMGHFHGFGKDYKITARKEGGEQGKVLYTADDEEDFFFTVYDDPYRIEPDVGLEYECNYTNPLDEPITWGSDTTSQEHCNMTVYFSPAEQLSEFCVVDMPVEASLVGLTPENDATIGAGDTTTVRLELDTEVTRDVTVELSVNAPEHVEAPDTVTIAAGTSAATFQVRGLQPIPTVTMTATLEGNEIATTLSVHGLWLSELFVTPAIDRAGLQWLELINTSSVPIDLSNYSLGAGVGSFLETRIPLSTTLAPNECLVIGGPVSAPENYNPSYGEIANVSPPLRSGESEAAGVALFSARTTAVNAKTVPLDAIIYGAESRRPLLTEDSVLTVSAPGVGRSVARVAPQRWTIAEVPTPGLCETQNEL